jgi:hypothetical protein
MKEKNVNLSISEGDAFFAHEVSVNFNPMQFVFDFKCITPRVDMRAREAPVFTLKHNVVMMDPYHAKHLAEMFTKAVKKYEENYGKIKKPEALQKHDKKAKKGKKEDVHEMPSYFG